MNIFNTLKESLKLKYNPVGVKLLYNGQGDTDISKQFKEPKKVQRYCEYVKRASNGDFLKLKKGDFYCVTAEIFLGFKEPEHIEFNDRLTIKNLEYLLLFPINQYYMTDFDSIILILNPRNCMNIIEAYVKIYNKMLEMPFGAFSGVCSEATAYVIKYQDVKFSFMCNGARIFAGFDDCELLCGVPNKMTIELVKELGDIVKERAADMELMKQLNEC